MIELSRVRSRDLGFDPKKKKKKTRVRSREYWSSHLEWEKTSMNLVMTKKLRHGEGKSNGLLELIKDMILPQEV